MNFKPALLAAAAFIAFNAQAVTVAQWNFNGFTKVADIKHNESMNGASISYLGVTPTLVSGAGSTDVAAGSSALNTANYAAQGNGNMTRGVQFGIDTSGYEHLTFSFDQRNSATGSSWTALLYTVDGSSWTKATEFRMATNSTFVNNISYSFDSIAGVNDNPLFAVRLVSMFAPGTSAYAGSGGTYGVGGTIRYDMVTLAGTEIIAAPVPEPESLALMLAGLAVVGTIARRRRAV